MLTEMDLLEGEFRYLCRVCGEKREKMINLFNSKWNDLSLSELLAKCIQKQINRNDAKPSRICLLCTDNCAWPMNSIV